MSILQFVVTITGIIFFFFGVDLYKRRKATLLHILVFFGGTLSVLFFIRNPNILNKFGNIFGLTRGADLIVYTSIIVILFFYIELLNSHNKNKQQLTKLISSMASQNSWKNSVESVFSFLNKNKSEKDEKNDYLIHLRCYNEEKTVGKVIDKIIKKGFHKILVLNDGSSDNSLEIIQNKQKEYPNSLIIIVSHDINRGPGAINQTGFDFCRRYGDLLNIKRIVMFDSDDQMDIEDMDMFIQKIKKENKVDAWFGSRLLGKKVEKMPLFRKFIVFKLGKIVSYILYKNKIEDYHCGFRLIKLDVIKKIFLTADGFHYANELVEIINNLKIKVKEVPVKIKYTEYSLSKGQKTSNAVGMGFEMFYRKFFFR